VSKRKKIRPGDVWTVNYVVEDGADEDDRFLAYISAEHQLINLDADGRTWPLNDDYWPGLVKRIQKGDGDPFMPECLLHPVDPLELRNVTLTPVESFEAGYYDFDGLLMYRNSGGCWAYYADYWKDEPDRDDSYFVGMGLNRY
jgi:hypothetical protein